MTPATTPFVFHVPIATGRSGLFGPPTMSPSRTCEIVPQAAICQPILEQPTRAQASIK